MKNKKVTVVIILVAIMLLGVGYASITGISLYINGVASANKVGSDFKIIFKKEIPKVNGGITSAIILGDTIAKLDVFLTEKNVNGENYAVFKVKNNSDTIKANIDVKFIEENNSYKEYFNIYSKLDKTILNSGEEAELKIYVDLKKVPKKEVNSNFTVNIIAKPLGE